MELLRLLVNGVLHVDNHAAGNVGRRSRVSRLAVGRTGRITGAALMGSLAAMVVLAAACSSGSPEELKDAPPSPASSVEPSVAQDSASVADGPVRSRPTMKITGIENWLNGEPTTIADEAAQDNVVLIDFWTYTCINCVRTIPRLRSWHDKYGDHGLTIIGIHSPEFELEFEKDTENVRRAIDRLGVSWLVVQDNDMATWRAFDNNVWPAKFLLQRRRVARLSAFR